MVEQFESLADVEKMKRASIKGSVEHSIPTAPAGVFQSVEEHAWISI